MTQYRFLLAENKSELAELFLRTGKLESALESFEECIDIVEELLEKSPDDAKARFRLHESPSEPRPSLDPQGDISYHRAGSMTAGSRVVLANIERVGWRSLRRN